MDQIDDWLQDVLHVQAQLPHTSVGKPAHVVKFVFAIAISVQFVFIFRWLKQLVLWFLHSIFSTLKLIRKGFWKLTGRQTHQDVVDTIPIICQTLLPSLKDDFCNGNLDNHECLNILRLTLTHEKANLSPNLMLKSAILWLLLDLLLLLNRCHRHKLALTWEKRLALTYRTIVPIPMVMERLAFAQTKRIEFPILLQRNETLLKLHKRSTVPISILRLRTAYMLLKSMFPFLVMPRYLAIGSKFDSNLEEYNRLSCLHLREKSARLMAATCSRESMKVGESNGPVIAAVPERCTLLSVTDLASALKDKSLSPREKTFLLRRQMVLRNVNSPKRWKWRSALAYMEANMVHSSSNVSGKNGLPRIRVSRPSISRSPDRVNERKQSI